MKTIIGNLEHNNFKEIFENENVLSRLQKECTGELIQKQKNYCSKNVYSLGWKGYSDKAVFYFNLLCNDLGTYKTLTLNKTREDGNESISFEVNYNKRIKNCTLKYTRNYFANGLHKYESLKEWSNYIKYLTVLSITDITRLDYFNINQITLFLKSYLSIDNFCTLDDSKFQVERKKDNENNKMILERKDLTEIFNEENSLIEDEIIRRTLFKKV